MANAVLTTMKRSAGLMSGKVLTEITGSALAIVAVTTLFGQWRGQPPLENASAPIYRPTLDPATGKIVDRISPETAGPTRVGKNAVATFVAAPAFVAVASITPWSASTQRSEARTAIRAPSSAEPPRLALAEVVPLPPARPIAVKAAFTPAVVPPPPAEEARPGRVERVASWLSPGRVVDGGAQVFASSRDAVYRAVSYGGNALSRLYP